MAARTVVEQPQAVGFVDDPKIVEALRELRRRTGTPVATYLRQAVRLVLAQHGVSVGTTGEIRPVGNPNLVGGSR